jgi:type IV pilus assembly protein PilW
LSFEERPGDDPVNFEPGTQLAYVTNCVDAAVLPVASYGGAGTLVMDTQLGGVAGPSCDSPGGRDMRVFNFSKDFVTITYYVELVADESPDARPNSAAAERLVPVLVRRENGVRQELVRGVDELKFLYGVQDLGGVTNFMDADAVDTGGACPPMPFGVTTQEPGCLWRAVRTIEAHLLVNTGDEVMGLDPISRSYRFMDVEFTPTDTSTLPSGLLARSMLRREFIAYASNRNYNF